jgi:hypothetical protein
MADKPYWWPQPMNDEWRGRLRVDYPEDTVGLSDDGLDEKYGEGWKYVDTWDHLGDARSDWQELADAFLKLVEQTGQKPSDFL